MRTPKKIYRIIFRELFSHLENGIREKKWKSLDIDMNRERSYTKWYTLSNMCSLTRTRDFVTFKLRGALNPSNVMKTLQFNFLVIFLEDEIWISKTFFEKNAISFKNSSSERKWCEFINKANRILILSSFKFRRFES